MQPVSFAQVMYVRHLVLMTDAVASIGDAHQLGTERGAYELRGILLGVGLTFNERRDGRAVRGIEGLIELVKQVEGGRVASLDGEDEGECDEGLLTAGELGHEVVLLLLGEADLHSDAAVKGDAGIVLIRLLGLLLPLFLVLLLLLLLLSPLVLALALLVLQLLVRLVVLLVQRRPHDELPGPVRDQLPEHVLEVSAHAAEGAVDRLVLLPIQTLDQFLHLHGTSIQLLLPLEQRFPLLRKVHVLIVRLLIDVTVLLQFLVDPLQTSHQRRYAQIGILLQFRRGGQRSQFLNFAHVQFSLGDAHGSFVQQAFGPLLGFLEGAGSLLVLTPELLEFVLGGDEFRSEFLVDLAGLGQLLLDLLGRLHRVLQFLPPQLQIVPPLRLRGGGGTRLLPPLFTLSSTLSPPSVPLPCTLVDQFLPPLFQIVVQQRSSTLTFHPRLLQFCLSLFDLTLQLGHTVLERPQLGPFRLGQIRRQCGPHLLLQSFDLSPQTIDLGLDGWHTLRLDL
mmetsp:Transcript_18849/g.54557  ORF Transcript_18849/g.54557 Transcript_18849/m.54557 type:complete len:505 (-) Transcript_18849:2418-3932(-)